MTPQYELETDEHPYTLWPEPESVSNRLVRRRNRSRDEIRSVAQ